jgi:hypothetical protein
MPVNRNNGTKTCSIGCCPGPTQRETPVSNTDPTLTYHSRTYDAYSRRVLELPRRTRSLDITQCEEIRTQSVALFDELLNSYSHKHSYSGSMTTIEVVSPAVRLWNSRRQIHPASLVSIPVSTLLAAFGYRSTPPPPQGPIKV